MPVPLSRRGVLQLAGLGSTALASAMLAGCRRSAAPALLSVRGDVPQAWIKALPGPWSAQMLESPQALLAALPRQEPGALLALGDGWAAQLDRRRLAPLQDSGLLELLGRLDPIAAPASRLFAPAPAPPCAFPWAFGTWLLLLRNRADLVARQGEGWALLLDPSLRRKLVLPSSPRLLIELALRQLGLRSADPGALEDPRLPAQLRRLHAQALALDERDGLNLLLSGEAEAAVVASHRAIPLLQRDPRLEAFLPASGAPLNWQLLLRLQHPGADQSSPIPWPLAWLRDGLSPPLLDRILAGGWVPPLPAAALQPVLQRWPARLRPLLLPPAAVLERCNSLPPFSAAEQQRWQRLWDTALAGS